MYPVGLGYGLDCAFGYVIWFFGDGSGGRGGGGDEVTSDGDGEG